MCHHVKHQSKKKVSQFLVVKNVEEGSLHSLDRLSCWTALTLKDRARPCSRDYVVKVNFHFYDIQ